RGDKQLAGADQHAALLLVRSPKVPAAVFDRVGRWNKLHGRSAPGREQGRKIRSGINRAVASLAEVAKAVETARRRELLCDLMRSGLFPCERNDLLLPSQTREGHIGAAEVVGEQATNASAS